jgi:hypothetical protein
LFHDDEIDPLAKKKTHHRSLSFSSVVFSVFSFYFSIHTHAHIISHHRVRERILLQVKHYGVASQQYLLSSHIHPSNNNPVYYLHTTHIAPTACCKVNSWSFSTLSWELRTSWIGYWFFQNDGNLDIKNRRNFILIPVNNGDARREIHTTVF